MKAAGREGGGGGVRLAVSGEGTKRRRGKQALPMCAPQLWLKVLTTKKKHNVPGEGIRHGMVLGLLFHPSSPFFFD